VLGAGCGPFGYVKKVPKDASKAVADAERQGAEEYAPYEYWGAVSYLEQAKIMMAYSEYERSFDYAVRAKQLAEEAKHKSAMREAGATEVSSPDVARPADPVEDDTPGEAGADKASENAAEGKASENAAEGKVEGKTSLEVGGGK
jgi:hypothetical protein